jgi:hypothetical protein
MRPLRAGVGRGSTRHPVRATMLICPPDRLLVESFAVLDGPMRQHVPDDAGVHEVPGCRKPDGRLLQIAESVRGPSAGQAAGLPGGGIQPWFGRVLRVRVDLVQASAPVQPALPAQAQEPCGSLIVTCYSSHSADSSAGVGIREDTDGGRRGHFRWQAIMNSHATRLQPVSSRPPCGARH